jgi:uncharacterized protein
MITLVTMIDGRVAVYKHGTTNRPIAWCDSRLSPICIGGFRHLNAKAMVFRELSMAIGSVRDNKVQRRFEMDVDGALAFANYRLTPSTFIITHTETPRELRGRGIASELVKGALELIRKDGMKVVAGCGFVVDYLKHPEFADLTG